MAVADHGFVVAEPREQPVIMTRLLRQLVPARDRARVALELTDAEQLRVDRRLGGA
jgi:hypothetical protein